MIWLWLILLLQYFILNRLISMFTYVRFLYAFFVMVIFYLRINLKLKILFILSVRRSSSTAVSVCVRDRFPGYRKEVTREENKV
jgi:hypothetical protein